MNLISENILQAVCWTLLHSLWQALFLAMLTGLIMIVSKKSSSTLRYNVLCIVFVIFVIGVFSTFYVEWHRLNELRMQTEIQISAAPGRPAIGSVPEKNISSNNIIQNYFSVFVGYFNTHASLIVTIWFIIFMAKCVRIFAGLVHIQRIRHYRINEVSDFWKDKIASLSDKLNIKKTVLLFESAIVKVPVVVGALKPVILIPLGLITNLSPAEVESILMHELAHIKRKDYFFNLLQSFVDVLFFFNPAILWISSLIRSERENCCDDIAIHQTQNKKQFIQALVSFHQYNQLVVSKYAMPFAEKKSRLLNRVKRIVYNNNSTLNPAEKVVLIVSLFIFSVVFISISNAQNVSQKKQNPQTKPTDAKVVPVSPKNSANPRQPANKKNPSTVNKKEKNVVVKPSPEPTADVNNERESENKLDDQMPLKGVSADQAIKMREHGVTIEFIEELDQLGYKNIPVEKLIQLKDHGVNADYIGGLQRLGFKNFSLDKARELKDHGVNDEYIEELINLGYNHISLDRAQELRDHGINADYIDAFHRLGYKNISLDEAQQLRDHGVNASYVNEFRKIGFTDIELEDARVLRDHGVNASFVIDFKNAGFKKISLDEAVRLRDHGVTIQFVENTKQKMGTDLSLDDYIRLRDR